LLRIYHKGNGEKLINGVEEKWRGQKLYKFSDLITTISFLLNNLSRPYFFKKCCEWVDW
jgi:hypothetical protein